VAMAEHYTADVVTVSLCPEGAPVIGREARIRQSEASLQRGFRDYVGSVKDVRVLRDGTVWSTGISEFTIAIGTINATSAGAAGVEAMRSAAISGKNHRATGEGAAEFRGTATKSLQNFGAPRSRLEIPEWFGRPYLRPYSVVAL
jgi:hypothetical protein